jgi:hypothetical protein
MSNEPGFESDKIITDEFSRQAEGADRGIVVEMFSMLHHNRKWWLTPIILCLLGAGLVLVVSGTAAAPFIYALF